MGNINSLKINLGAIQKKGSSKLKKREINSKILFRTDASYMLGIGHVIRCLSLAEWLRKLGYEPIFLSRNNPIVRKTISGEYPIIKLPKSKSLNEEIFNVRNIIGKMMPLATILDLNNVNHDYFMAIKQFSGLLVDINGESSSDLYSDIIVKGDVGTAVNRQPYADYYLGPKYKIVASRVSGIRDKNRKPKSKINKILVSMGGTDPNNLTLGVVRALLYTDVEINIVIGLGFDKERERELFDTIREKKHCLIQRAPEDFHRLLAEADICFVSGGITLYEAICLGTPSIVLCQNQSQIYDALMLEKHKCCICLGLGRKVSLRTIRNSLQKISCPHVRKEMQKKGMKVLDGLATERIARAIHGRIETIRGKKLLIVGSGSEQIPLIKSAKSMGCQIIAVDGDPYAPGFLSSDYPYVIDTKDVDSIRLIANKHSIDGIITSTETGINSVAIISSERGYPITSRLSSLLLLDKLKIKEQFTKHNIPTAPYAAVTTVKEALEAAKKIGMPVILKPCDNAAARGVIKVRKSAEMGNAYNYAVRNTKLPYILVEKFLRGEELGCEAFLFNGKIRLIVLTDKTKSKPPYNVVMGHTIPCLLSHRMERAVVSIVKQSLRALKIERGPVNLDIVLTDTGPRVIDVGTRLGGNNLPLLVYLAKGVNTYKEAVKTALGIKPNLKARFKRASRMYYLKPRTGKVRSINGSDSLVHIEGLICFKVGIRPGNIVREVTDVSHRVGSFIVSAPSLNKLRVAAKKINRTLQISTSN